MTIASHGSFNTYIILITYQVTNYEPQTQTTKTRKTSWGCFLNQLLQELKAWVSYNWHGGGGGISGICLLGLSASLLAGGVA